MKIPRNHSWAALAAIVVAGIGCVTFGIGFVLLPNTVSSGTLWERICRAAGTSDPAGAPIGSVAGPGFTSVVIPVSARTRGTPREIGNGATLALRCTACHGAQGLSGANAPNLAGQYSEVIYKQLVDFKRGARSDAVMGAMAAPLTDEQMLDLAHYYAYLPRPQGDGVPAEAPTLVRVGDPMRNIAPCASCHAARDGKVGAPALEGEPKMYLVSQLTAFADGSRENDANAVMREETHRLTPMEIATLTDHYAAKSSSAEDRSP